MKFDLFQYRLPLDRGLDDLNSFLAAHRIVAVTHHVIAKGEGGLLVFVVESSGRDDGARPAEPRVDYRDRLSAAHFKVFSRLRELRKEIAEREGIPVYAVFSNSQLAQMVEKGIADDAGLRGIAGMGEGRVEKYGRAFLEELAKERPRRGTPDHEGTRWIVWENRHARKPVGRALGRLPGEA